MINAKAGIAIALLCSATLGFFYWRHCATARVTAVQALVLGDLSESVSNQEGIAMLGRRALGIAGIKKESTLTILATGDRTTGDEPMLVAKYAIPVSRRALEGKSAEMDRKETIIADLAARWNQINRSDRSPIFLAVRRGVEQLRSSGCTPEMVCYLFIKSDGLELSEPAIKEALRDPQSQRALPAAIPNEGIRVVFCGLCETTGNMSEEGRQGRRAQVRVNKGVDHVRDVWISLFTQPELVTFEPYCRETETILAKKD